MSRMTCVTDARRAGIPRNLVGAFSRVGPVVLAVLTVGITVVEWARRDQLGVDFRTVTPEIRGLAQGVNPYVIEGVGEGGHFLWSVLAGWLLAPFAWLPYGYVLVVLLQVVGLVAAAMLLGVRDLRLVALALAWPATVNSVQTANITVLVVLFLAAAWRTRDRARTGLWVGLAVGVKFIAWPALVWLAATRRWRALGIAVAVQVGTLALTLPYISLSDFLEHQREVDRRMSEIALTLNALLQDIGASERIARGVWLAVGLAVLWLGRRNLGWVTAAMLLLSPIVWLHYFGLLLVPLALWSRSPAVWALPLLLWITPGMGNGATWQTAGTLAALALVLWCASAGQRREQPGSVPAAGSG